MVFFPDPNQMCHAKFQKEQNLFITVDGSISILILKFANKLLKSYGKSKGGSVVLLHNITKSQMDCLSLKKQEAHGPHHSPEKTVQINKHI